MRLVLFFLLLLATSSCKRSPLEVEAAYFTRKDLASVHVGTPDPNKLLPIFGQRLYIKWDTQEISQAKPPLELFIRVMLKKGKMLEEKIPLKESSGSYLFPIVGANFSDEGGLLSYKIELLSQGKVIATSRHKFWVEPIKFSDQE